ncbi:serpin-ZX-like protein [Tanacetum coccineum]
MDIQQLITNQIHVSVTLANHLFPKQSSNSNVVFSPLSIHVVLSLIATGSKDQTLNELLAFLKTNNIYDLSVLSSQLVSLMADGSSNGRPCLSFANGVWVEKMLSLKPSFKQVLETVYNANSNQVDFQNKAAEITKEVNLWAHQQTNGLINEILPAGAVDDATRLIFANAVYFKGAWNEKFDPSKTKDYDFHLLDGSKVQVPFMTSKKKQFVREYDGSESDFLDHHTPHQKTEVGQFLIPKFKMSFGFEASVMLKELGLVLPFTGKEGWTEMVDPAVGQNLYVSSIHHKSFIEVNEEGTEAAAVTAGIFMLTSLRRPDVKVDFVADHPFFFVIREDISGVVLFMGQVIDPQIA